MSEKELKERLSAVLQALNTLHVSGMNNVQALAGSMTILAELIKTPVDAETADQ